MQMLWRVRELAYYYENEIDKKYYYSGTSL